MHPWLYAALVNFWVAFTLCTHGRVKREEGEDLPALYKSGRSVFQIDKRYPVGNSGEVPTVILKKDVTVEFNCSSYDPWEACIWKAPFTTTPCLMFISGSSSQSEDCSDWKSTSNYQIRYEFKNNLHVCSLHGKIGIDSNHPDEGKWNCRMETQPSEASIYQVDQQFFEVKLLKPATVFVDIHRGKKMEEDE